MPEEIESLKQQEARQICGKIRGCQVEGFIKTSNIAMALHLRVKTQIMNISSNKRKKP